MDLRGFSPANAGCLYEIGEVLDAVPLARVVFLVDATTDAAFLRASLARLWGAVPAGSPNRRLAAPELVTFAARSGSAREIRSLLRLLLARREDGGAGRETLHAALASA